MCSNNTRSQSDRKSVCERERGQEGGGGWRNFEREGKQY